MVYRAKQFGKLQNDKELLQQVIFGLVLRLILNIEDLIIMKSMNINVTYYERINGVLNWLNTSTYVKRPKFITLYFDAADTYGHKFGTNSDELINPLQWRIV